MIRVFHIVVTDDGWHGSLSVWAGGRVQPCVMRDPTPGSFMPDGREDQRIL
jgi:hypothetical protein